MFIFCDCVHIFANVQVNTFSGALRHPFTMRQLLALVLFLSCLSPASEASEGFHTYRISLQQEFSYARYPDAQAEAVNALLLHIAEGAGKLRVRTSYGARIDVEMMLERVHRDSLLARVVAKEVTITGDKHYKDFSLEQLMIPDAFSIQWHVLDEQNDTVFHSAYQNQRLDIPLDDWPKHLFYFSGDLYGLSVAFDDLAMHYKAQMDDRLTQWRAALLSYYDASASIDIIASEIADLDPSDPNTLLLDEFKLCEAEAMAGEIRHAAFHDWLDLDAHDPEDVLTRFQNKKSQIDHLRRSFNHAIANLDALYYAEGRALVAEEGWDAAREAFASALHYSPFHVPSHLGLAEADIRAGELVYALDRLGHVIADMQPLNARDKHSAELADTLVNTFFTHARELIEADRLTSSLDTLQHVRTFCYRVQSHYACPEQLQYLVDTSHLGIYRSFLTVATRAIRNDDVGFARMYVESALDYQYRHQKHIPDALDAKHLLLRVMTRQRVLADIAMLGGNYDLSGDYRTQTASLAADHPELFHYVYTYGDKEQLKAAALNYAVAGSPEESVSLLKKLKNMGLQASDLSYHQRTVAAEAAIWLRNMQPEADPDELLTGLTARDPWFQVFDKTFHARWQ